jgi:WXG100 family type VII secretion target
MASGIAVTPERLREISAQMSTGASNVEAILSRLSGDVAPVRSEWVGAAQMQFNVLWDQLQQDASGVRSVLKGMARLTDSAATAYEATEKSVAQSFDEFRIERDMVHAVDGVFSAASSGSDFDLVDAVQAQPSQPSQPAEQLVEQTEGGETTVSEPSSQLPDFVTTTVFDIEAVESDAVTEVEDTAVDETDQSVDRPKVSSRLPWTRFMAKAAHTSETGEVTLGSRVRERRFKTSDPDLKPGTRLCRLCFTVVVLEPEYIETTETHVYVCCPHCGRSFPIRASDV